MSLLIGLLGWFTVALAIALLSAGLILDSRRENQIQAHQLARIGAGVGLLGIFYLTVVAAREHFLGMTWWMVGLIPILIVGTSVAARLFDKRRPKN